MVQRMRGLILSFLLALSASLSGCLKHEEKLTIKADGSALVEIQIKGDGGDLSGGAARLPDRERYDIERFTKPKEDGGEEHYLVAKASFSAVSEMPESYAQEKDAHKQKALRFKNRLVVRQLEQKTIYIYTRGYEPRSWARYQFHHDKAFSDEIKELLKGEWEAKSWEQRKKVIEAFLSYEQGKQIEWTAQALEGLTIQPRQKLERGAELEARRAEAETVVRRALKEFFTSSLTAERVSEILKFPQEEMGKKVEQIEAQIEKVIVDAVKKSLAGSGEAGQINESRLLANYRAARHDFEVSEDLGDESFEVSVTMPGRLLGSNGDQQAGNTVRWKFSGTDLRDRRQRLMAVSVVSKLR